MTPDEIPDPENLKMELRVNGEKRQSSYSGNMAVTIPEILAHYSALGYSAGDVLSTGTVSGVAAFSDDPGEEFAETRGRDGSGNRRYRSASKLCYLLGESLR